MNDQKVIKTKLVAKKKIHLNLHQRITEFRKKEVDIAAYLLAIKWIGNVGSHTGKIEKVDLIDAFKLLEHSIENLYENKSKAMLKLKMEIVKKKGPRSKKRQKNDF